MKQDLLTVEQLNQNEILEVLNAADQLKYEKKHGIPHRHLEGKTIGLLFEKPSTRTRVSFEVGMYDLGGQALFLAGHDLQVGRGESDDDTARVLSRYLDGLVIRTHSHEKVLRLAGMSSVPVINGMTDYAHPCQILGDLMTIREAKGKLRGRTLTYVGTGCAAANSVLIAASKMGMTVRCAIAPSYPHPPHVMEILRESGDVTFCRTAAEAATGADVVYTSAWFSLGNATDGLPLPEFSALTVDETVMANAAPDVLFLHPLPAHRGQEVTSSVLEAHADDIFLQAENRLHAQKAILVKLLS